MIKQIEKMLTVGETGKIHTDIFVLLFSFLSSLLIKKINKVYLIYNIALVSGIQHNDLVLLQIIFHYSLLQDILYYSYS